MSLNFNKVMTTAIDSLSGRMDQLHERYMHLFEEGREEDGADIQEFVDGVMKQFDGLLVLVEEIGSRIEARRGKPEDLPTTIEI